MKDILFLVAWFIGPLTILWAANEAWYASAGRMRVKLMLLSGLVGVPLHELSHALTATVFGMRVVDLKLYKPDPQSNSLGYVNYLYRPGSPVHAIGRFFVGFSPTIFGGLAVSFLFNLTGVVNLDKVISPTDLVWAAQSGNYFYVAHALTTWISCVFSSIGDWPAVMAVFTSMMIALHATPSRADLGGASVGGAVVFGVIFLLMILKHSIPGIYYPYIARFVDLPSLISAFAVRVIQMAAIGAVTATAMITLSLLVAELRRTQSAISHDR